MDHSRTKFLLVFAAATALFSLGCTSGPAATNGKKTDAEGGPVQLKGAGATFPYLAYSKWLEGFKQDSKNVDISYKQTGSEAGITQLEAGTIDFAGTDVPLTDEQIAKFKVKPLHFPTLLGSVVPIYNVAGAGELKFTAAALAGIFSGKIKKWNDPALVKANPGVSLPAAGIVLTHRSEGSGTTYVLTDFLSKTSDVWQKTIGKGMSVKWAGGTGVEGSEPIAQKVKATPNSIGYVELNYAVKNKVSYGSVQNSSGKFVKAGLESVGAAADAAEKVAAEDFRVSITNPPGANAYPICSFTWILVPGQMTDTAKQAALRNFLAWSLRDGQKIAMEMDYGVLPPTVLANVRDLVDRYR